MKKPTIAIFALLTLTLAGCVKETKEQRDARYSYHIETITYKGHNYIVLSATKWCNGITHDPDCPCQSKNLNQECQDEQTNNHHH